MRRRTLLPTLLLPLALTANAAEDTLDERLARSAEANVELQVLPSRGAERMALPSQGRGGCVEHTSSARRLARSGSGSAMAERFQGARGT